MCFKLGSKQNLIKRRPGAWGPLGPPKSGPDHIVERNYVIGTVYF